MTAPRAGGRPAPRVRRQERNRAVLVASVLGLVVAAVVVALVVRYAAQNPDEVNIGDEEFAVGDADRFAQRIAEDDQPLLFKDPLSGGPAREIYVHHLGDDPDEGWHAFEAYAPGAPREVRCILEWQPARDRFVDPCGDATFPPDGEGLRRFPVEVEDGVVIVNLRSTRG